MPQRLADIVNAHGLEHRLIIVEITESAMIHEDNLMREMVAALHENGFEFSIDDFGSGLSSLSMVADTLPDEIKLDRSLLKKNCEDERERIILESIFQFAARLNIRTVAEGVETKEQLGFLRTCNCNLIQGFYFAKPMPENEFRECLVSRCRHNEEDILEIQSEAAAVQLLLQAVCMRYPLIIYGNLTRNSFYTILSIKDYQIWDGFFALAKLNGGRRSSATLLRIVLYDDLRELHFALLPVHRHGG